MTPIVEPKLEEYAHEHTKPRGELFDEMREFTYSSMRAPQMQVGRIEGTFLKTLVAISGARRVLEIGTFTGYSGLSMAEALPDDGTLTTCDVDARATSAARGFFDRSPHGKKITIMLGDATKTIAAMPIDPPFDLVFIDADKENYPIYYELALPRLKQGGLLVADNTLWSGRVLAPADDEDRAIIAFNAKVQADPRVENVLLTVRDGMMLARKL
jgi:caffeoyl-CoA O-methyltransferase